MSLGGCAGGRNCQNLSLNAYRHKQRSPFLFQNYFSVLANRELSSRHARLAGPRTARNRQARSGRAAGVARSGGPLQCQRNRLETNMADPVFWTAIAHRDINTPWRLLASIETCHANSSKSIVNVYRSCVFAICHFSWKPVLSFESHFECRP